eukprot:5817710-Prymnesium_polylepis.1
MAALSVGAALALAASPEPPDRISRISVRKYFFVDELGRVRLFRGFNVSAPHPYTFHRTLCSPPHVSNQK